MILSERAGFELALKLREKGAPLGDVYSFISGLYFRGKLAYAESFAAPPPGLHGTYVITPGRALLPSGAQITASELRDMATIPVDAGNVLYRAPLLRDARTLNERAGPDCRFVLLGSLATAKYLEPLMEVFGERLLVPNDFAGRGDMSRGGLLLRCARGGEELSYTPAHQAPRHGPRPPRLEKIPRVPS